MNRSTLVGVGLVGCVIWAAGCAAQTEGNEKTADQTSAWGLPPPPPPPGEGLPGGGPTPPPPPPCPGQPGAVRSVWQGPGDHADASRFVAYLFGASADDVGLPNTPACWQVENTLDQIRARLASGYDQLINVASVTTVCGLPAAVYEITNEGQTIARLAPQVDACIGHFGSAPFFYYKADAVNGFVDPTVATLTDNLGVTQGASASAYWSDTGVPTSVVEWPGTVQSGSWAPGMPCSTTGLYPGAQAGRHIVSLTKGLIYCK